MSTPAEKVKYLNETKIAIREAIAAKGVAVAEDATFRSYAESIAEIETGGGALPEQEKFEVYTENGMYYILPKEGYTISKANVTVNVPQPEWQDKTIEVTENGLYQAVNDDGYALHVVSVNVNVPEPVIESLEITENGTYTAPAGVDGYSPITVNVPTGGGGGGDELPAEAYIISGNCNMMFMNNNWAWYIDKYGAQVTTKDITNASQMFYYSDKLTRIPFELNFVPSSSWSPQNTITSMFESCTSLTEVPKINGCMPSDTNGLFSQCYSLRSIPDDIEDWFDWSYIDNSTSTWQAGRRGMFSYCYSLRSIPMGFLNHGNPVATSSSYLIYNNLCQSCYALDEIVGIPFPHKEAITSETFGTYAFYQCMRLKNLTFAVQEDGTPYVMNWKNQTIDLTEAVGYATQYVTTPWPRNILNYNSGITADKEVNDDASYQALKNDPDWFATDVAYSRYNHDSAVATINSLPDTTSSGGTNTIKFRGEAGSATDGGAINTLTEEEIAVATAKGWTVTLV